MKLYSMTILALLGLAGTATMLWKHLTMLLRRRVKAKVRTPRHPRR